jgi:hypothetical protein
MSVSVLIPKTTTAYTSPSFSPIGKNNIALCCNVLFPNETITLQVYDSANEIWANAKYNGQVYQLNSTNNFMSISNDTQRYRVVKSVTGNAVGLDTISDIKMYNLSDA